MIIVKTENSNEIYSSNIVNCGQTNKIKRTHGLMYFAFGRKIAKVKKKIVE